MSYLTLPIFEKPINSWQDLADRPDIQLLVPADSVLSQVLLGRTFLESMFSAHLIVKNFYFYLN